MGWLELSLLLNLSTIFDYEFFLVGRLDSKFSVCLAEGKFWFWHATCSKRLICLIWTLESTSMSLWRACCWLNMFPQEAVAWIWFRLPCMLSGLD